jgi:hypothetical protein
MSIACMWFEFEQICISIFTMQIPLYLFLNSNSLKFLILGNMDLLSFNKAMCV